MSINFATATREEIEAYVKELEQQVKTKKTNKIKNQLLNDLKELFNKQFPNNTDSLLWLYFLLSVLYNNLELSTIQLLDELDYVPEEEDVKKVFIAENKALIKTDEFKLRKSKKTTTPIETEETKEITTPL